MGAQAYTDLYIGTGTVREAFKELREQAKDENGHQQGYSGDIQTASGFSRYRKTTLPRFGTSEFYETVDDIAWNLNKGECYYVEVTGNELKYLKDKRGFKGKRNINAYYFFGCGGN